MRSGRARRPPLRAVELQQPSSLHRARRRVLHDPPNLRRNPQPRSPCSRGPCRTNFTPKSSEDPEEGRRVLEDVTLLLQAPHALTQLSELLALGAGDPVIALALIALALTAPVPQRL